MLRGIVPSYANCIFIRQPAPVGFRNAVPYLGPVVGDELLFAHPADEFIDVEQAHPCE